MSVRRFLLEVDEPTRRRLSLGCALSLLAIFGFRKRENLHRYIVSSAARRSYLSATEAPLSHLYKATRDGSVERALLGATGVFFLSGGTWRKSSLPPNSPDIQKELFHALSTACDNVRALPESIADRLVTPILAALPFLYLAFVYRMMQNLNGKEGCLAKSYSQSAVTTSFRDVGTFDCALCFHTSRQALTSFSLLCFIHYYESRSWPGECCAGSC
jgi:hypothetical protein